MSKFIRKAKRIVRAKWMPNAKWISAQINEIYSDDPLEGIKGLQEGDQVIIEIYPDGRRHWYKISSGKKVKYDPEHLNKQAKFDSEEPLTFNERTQLSNLSSNLKGVYDLLENVFPRWRKQRQPNHLFQYLSEAQEECITARRKILELLGST